MSNNGTNNYGVQFSNIMFLNKIITGHKNVRELTRENDIEFAVSRIKQNDIIKILCVDEYVLSESRAQQIVIDFPNVDIIYIGGKWNKSSPEATTYCRTRKIGVYNSGGINGAISTARYW